MTLTGQNIGRYHILEQLGQGGMATVYKAFDTRLEREVAVKIIRTDAFAPAILDRLLQRFEREAKSVAQMSHPAIVKVHDYGEYQGAPYLVMELLAGGTLKDKLDQPVSFPTAVRLILPIARALDYAHRRGVLHRDVKPGNILFSDEGETILTDFGIAKLLENEKGQTITGTGVGVGTPEYMAPEQGLGKEIDGRADIYALGIVFYELITGQKPYTADTPLAVLLMQVNDPLPRPRDFVKDLPEEVERVLFKTLAKNPDDRYENMAAYTKALEKLTQVTQNTIPDPKPILSPKPFQTTVLDQNQETFDDMDRTRSDQTPESLPSKSAIPVQPQKSVFDRKPIIHELLPQKQIKKSHLPGWLVWAGAGLIVTLLLVWVITSFITPAMGRNQTISATNTTNVEQTAVAFSQITGKTATAAIWTATPGITAKPSITATPSFTATPNYTPTPALGIGSTQVRDKDGMLQVFVPAGEFEMGSNDGSLNEKPVHNVYLDAFWIDQIEVTNAQYEQCVSDSACSQSSSLRSLTHGSYYGNAQYADYPVIYVNWNQADAYCQWTGSRLPSEAELEKAARDTDGRTYPWGNASPADTLLNNNENIGDTTEVGSYPEGASPYGALDMAGNVSEWVADWYDENYYSSQTDWNNPTGPSSGEDRVLRGGAWFVNDFNVRSASRIWFDPSNTNNVHFGIGFRCASSN